MRILIFSYMVAPLLANTHQNLLSAARCQSTPAWSLSRHDRPLVATAVPPSADLIITLMCYLLLLAKRSLLFLLIVSRTFNPTASSRSTPLCCCWLLTMLAGALLCRTKCDAERAALQTQRSFHLGDSRQILNQPLQHIMNHTLFPQHRIAAT